MRHDQHAPPLRQPREPPRRLHRLHDIDQGQCRGLRAQAPSLSRDRAEARAREPRQREEGGLLPALAPSHAPGALAAGRGAHCRRGHRGRGRPDRGLRRLRGPGPRAGVPRRAARKGPGPLRQRQRAHRGGAPRRGRRRPGAPQRGVLPGILPRADGPDARPPDAGAGDHVRARHGLLRPRGQARPPRQGGAPDAGGGQPLPGALLLLRGVQPGAGRAAPRAARVGR